MQEECDKYKIMLNERNKIIKESRNNNDFLNYFTMREIIKMTNPGVR